MPSYTGRRRLLSDAEICRLYAEMQDGEGVGLKAGLSGSTVLKIVRANGGVVLPRGARRGHPYRAIPLSDADIVAMYQGGRSGVAIAEIAGCGEHRIYSVLDAAGVPRRDMRELGRARARARRAARGAAQ